MKRHKLMKIFMLSLSMLKMIMPIEAECVDGEKFVKCEYGMLYKPTKLKIYHDFMNQKCDINRWGEYYNCYKSIPKNTNANIFGSFIPTFTSDTIVSNNLNSLVINNCGITEVHSNAFQGLLTLTKIDFSNNNISILEDSAFSIPNLVTLNLKNNSITVLQNALILPSLEFLDLSENKIVTTNDDFIRLPQLQTLNLEINKISILESNVFYNLNVKEINLAFNNISIIKSNAFHNLEHLNKLNLEYNNLEIIETDSFKIVPAITFIDLSHNKITSVNNITGVSSIQTLYLNNNAIKNLDCNLFKSTESILNLNLSENVITTIPNSLFIKLSDLTSLDISNNLISDVNVGTFVGLSKLSSLNLDGNRIKSISAESFHNTPKLEKLYLNNNSIENIDATQIAQLTSLKNVSISNNNLTCIKLSKILKEFKVREVNVQYGMPRGEISIHGIDCMDGEEEIIASNNLQEYFSTEFTKSRFYKFFKDFQINQSERNYQPNIDELLQIMNSTDNSLTMLLELLSDDKSSFYKNINRQEKGGDDKGEMDLLSMLNRTNVMLSSIHKAVEDLNLKKNDVNALNEKKIDLIRDSIKSTLAEMGVKEKVEQNVDNDYARSEKLSEDPVNSNAILGKMSFSNIMLLLFYITFIIFCIIFLYVLKSIHDNIKIKNESSSSMKELECIL